MVSKLKEGMSKTFDMKDLGPARQILGMYICHERDSKRYGYHKRNTLNECLRCRT